MDTRAFLAPTCERANRASNINQAGEHNFENGNANIPNGISQIECINRVINMNQTKEHSFANGGANRPNETRQIERIEAMETALNEIRAANETLEEALLRYEQAQNRANELSDYLGSDEWLAAREADDAGQLPAGLKRGVLSEDGAYNVLADNRETAIRMLEIATEVVR